MTPYTLDSGPILAGSVYLSLMCIGSLMASVYLAAWMGFTVCYQFLTAH